MTAFDIYSALGNVSEELLEESELFPKKTMPKGILYMTAAAACFAVLAVGLRFAFNDGGIAAPEQGELVTVGDSRAAADVTQYTSPQTTETTRVTVPLPLYIETGSGTDGEANADFTSKYECEETTVGTADTTANLTTAASASELVHRDEAEDPERYLYLDYNGAVYSRTMEKFDESELTFLQNGELYDFGGDERERQQEEAYDDDYSGHKRYSIPCAFYKIKNVNENYMIAALTADGSYAAFKNHGFFPDTLGGYLEDIDFYNRAELMPTIGSYTWDENGMSTFSECYLRDIQQAVEKFLAENSDALPEANIPPVLGRYTINCRNGSSTAVMICDGGYIMVGNVFFNIGEDKTESFMKYIRENSAKDDANETDIPE